MDIIDISSSDADDYDYVQPVRSKKKGKGKAQSPSRATSLEILDVYNFNKQYGTEELINLNARAEVSSAGERSQGIVDVDNNFEMDPLAQVLEIVPDVEPTFAQSLIDKTLPELGDKVVETVLHTLFEDRSYPKSTKKRKADSAAAGTSSSKKARVVDYRSTDRPHEGGPQYRELAVDQLSIDFPTFRINDLRRLLDSKNGFYAPTYLFIKDQQRRGLDLGCRPKKAATRTSAKGKGCAREDEELEKEKEWLIRRGPTPEPQIPEDEGEGIECGCCFTEAPFSKMIQCADAHLFCSDCVRQYAETLLGSHDVAIVCMDQSGCKLPFPESELRRLLSSKLWELYERVKQRKDIEAAGLDDLEECPNCDYKCVIDNPDEKLFRCGNDDACGAVTCRQCKKPDHLPKSCKEMEEDKHLDGRHAIEEAMTAALMRNCPKCNKSFVKEAGCNKMLCPQCRTLSCYVCREVITGYEHFNNYAPGHPMHSSSNKCLLWDTSVEGRHSDDVKKAAERALAEYKAHNPDVLDSDIRVDLPFAPPPPPAPTYFHPYAGLDLHAAFPHAGLGGMAAFGLARAHHVPRIVPPPRPRARARRR